MNITCHNMNEAASPRHPHRATFRFLVFPLAVFVLANIVFSLVAFDIDVLLKEVKGEFAVKGTSINRFAEARTRLFWATSVLIFYCSLISTAVYCISVIRRCLPRKEKVFVFAVGVLIAGVVLGYLIYSGYFRTNFSYIFLFTFESLAASTHYTASELITIKAVVSILNVLAALVPALALITGCSILCPRRDTDDSELEFLEGQMRQLKTFTVIGSTLLVAGVLHMIVWLRWSASLVDNVRMSQDVVNFSEALGLYWGAAFSVIAATFYIPAAWSISRQASILFEQNLYHTQEMEMPEWLSKHGLSVAPLRQMPQFVAVLAPLLAGPVGSALVKLSGS